MNDELNYKVAGLTQHAQGSITYGEPAVGDTVIVNSDTLTCVAESPAAGEFSSIAELEALIEALTGINSEVAGGVINIVAAAPGAAGNAITLALGVGNTGTMAISGVTLTGGVDATYTDPIEFSGGVNPEQVDAVIDIDALTAAGTVVVTPQTSMDKENWIDRTASATLNATGVSELHTTEPLAFFRYKIVLGGTAPTASLKINARKSA